MTAVKDIKRLGKIIKENSPKFLLENGGTLLVAACGDLTAQAQCVALLGKGIKNIPDSMMYSILNDFLHDIPQNQDDLADMRNFLVAKGEKPEHCDEIIGYINKAINSQRFKYIINLTRFASTYDMKLSLYFRICNSINTVMEEDLLFLKDNIGVIEKIERNHFKANYHTQKLYTIGAMRIIDTIWKNGEYAFTPFGRLLDASTVSFDDDARYPNPRKVIEEYEEQED